MTKLYSYFKNDFKYITLDRKLTFGIKHDNETDEIIEIEEKVLIEHNSSARFFTFYIPASNLAALFCREILMKFKDHIDFANGVEMIGGFANDLNFGKHTSVYSNRIYFYTENPIGAADLQVLAKIAEENNLFFTIRSRDYVKKKMEIDKPLAFISHDSRDKELIAKPLANGLSSRLCSVWYDEYSLNIGDSLRESIEKGIKEVKKCVILITKNFLNNPGWGKKEFNSIFTREMIFNERVVLPIWFGVTTEEVYEYSPSLADTVALIWPNKEDLSEEEYKKSVELIISKVHTAINK
ncbi:toll/interleukin-1 receptor domain-containing protein [Flagellimonas zhangzhouensis]|uniref:TIR domain-containing protein n=1 Tax=Flagellimonas zhangzhouensis TaxID=1073328 RepID=A0A1H2SDX5_9FLAO|nr:toll/interleukin-1 receptor domain-containing protein [Allomuricauda zhangzhouensis]SDQ73779.1 TIR domain-containing protein [Allomuricauda zhangzhouensis]SDW29883.1 TIR domain-containing protein [Allomuricauda zhangzhouensis]